MKKSITCVSLFLFLVCSAQAVTVNNYLVSEWCTNAAWASNPYGNWVYRTGYNGDRVLPYVNLTNYVEEGIYVFGWARYSWSNDETENSPVAGLDTWSTNPDDDACQINT